MAVTSIILANGLANIFEGEEADQVGGLPGRAGFWTTSWPATWHALVSPSLSLQPPCRADVLTPCACPRAARAAQAAANKEALDDGVPFPYPDIQQKYDRAAIQVRLSFNKQRLA